MAKWFGYYRTRLFGVSLAIAGLAWVWYSTGVAAVSGHVVVTRWTYLAQATLRGLYSLGTLLDNPWFVGFLLVVVIFGKQVRAFLARATSVEVSGLKLNSAEITEPTLVLNHNSVWTTGPWGPPEADVPGGDGPMLQKKDPATANYKDYAQCMYEMVPLFNGLTQDNQDRVGGRFAALEKPWNGDYVEQLELTVKLLQEAVKRGVTLTDKYLATSLTLRLLMLYMQGQHWRLKEFLAALEHVAPEHLPETFSQSYSMRLLIAVCEAGKFDVAQRIADLPVMKDVNECRLSRAAYLSYIALKQHRYSSAYGLALAALQGAGDAQSDKRFAPPLSMLHYVAAMAASRTEHYIEACMHASQVLAEHRLRPVYKAFVRRDARRVLCQANLQLGWHQRIYDLYMTDPDAWEDPFVMNAMAVALASDKKVSAARTMLRKALALPHLSAEKELQETLVTNASLLRV